VKVAKLRAQYEKVFVKCGVSPGESIDGGQLGIALSNVTKKKIAPLQFLGSNQNVFLYY
jgi:hypothetical protein